MSKKFIAYFDYLGFKDFIERNELDYQIKIMDNIFRDIENAFAQGKLVPRPDGGYIADLSLGQLRCTNFSDTVVFWTKDNSIDSLVELLKVTYHYNWNCNLYFFPIRGSVVLGELIDVRFYHKNEKGGSLGTNSIFGKGLVQSHLKAESQNWAGTVIDETVIQYLKDQEANLDDFLHPYAKKYKVPYKLNIDNQKEEWAINLIANNGALNEEAFKNTKGHIEENFASHNKRVDIEAVQTKLANTIAFLASYKPQ